MKRTLMVLLAIAILTLLIGCSSGSSDVNSATPEPEKVEVNTRELTKEEFEQMYTDANKFKGCKVDFYAQIFQPIERDEDAAYMQVFADPENSEKNTIVAVGDPQIDLQEDDIIHVVGIVHDEFKGKNAFGAELRIPRIIADMVEKADYVEAFSPAIKTVELNQEQDQYGYVMKINKVEFAEKETRVYLSITNNMDEEIRFYTFNAKATQGNKQFEEESNYDADYPEPQSEILPGITTEGIVLFEAMNPNEPAKFILEGSSGNYRIDIKPFIFEIE